MTTTEIVFKNPYCALLIVISLISSAASAFEHPGGITTKEQVRKAAMRIKSNQNPWSVKWKRLLRAADSRLKEKPSAVKNLDIPAYYKNRSASVRASHVLAMDVWSAYPAAAVYAINAEMSGRTPRTDKYAEQVVRIANDWAWTNKGFSGGNAGLTPCVELIGLLQAAELVFNYPGWSSRDKAQFMKWAKTVLYDEADIKNRGLKGKWYSNWNDWGIVTALAIDHLTDDRSRFSQDANLLEKLISMQIEPNGSLPQEQSRGKLGIVYTSFALEPMTAAVEIVRNSGGRDLRHWNPPGGGSVKNALDYLYNNGFENPSRWPVSSARRNASNANLADELFAAMSRVYGVRKWANFQSPDFPDLYTGRGWIIPELFEPTP